METFESVKNISRQMQKKGIDTQTNASRRAKCNSYELGDILYYLGNGIVVLLSHSVH